MKHYVPNSVGAKHGIIVVDAKGLYDALRRSSRVFALTEIRSGMDLLGLKDSVEKHVTDRT